MKNLVKTKQLPALSAEEKIVLKLARTKLSASESKEISDSFEQAAPDLNRLYQVARRHVVLPLVGKHLLSLGVLQKDREIAAKWRSESQFNLARNHMLCSELEFLLQALKADKIDTLALKGPALAMQAYGDLSLRRFVDLDVLCSSSQILAALKILAGCGYETHPQLSDSQINSLLENQHAIQFVKKNQSIVVELHWQAVPRNYMKGLDADIFWQQPAAVIINNFSIETLSPEMHLLFLCVHGAKHSWNRLSYICDIAELLRSQTNLKWDEIYSHIKNKSFETMFYLALNLAASLLQAPLPAIVQNRIDDDRRLKALTQNVCSLLFEISNSGETSGFEMLSFNLQLRRDWRDRLAFFKYLTAPTDKDLSSYSFSTQFEALYYALRPYRLLTSFRKHH